MSDYGTPVTPAADNGKTAAIVSYITFIGWLVSYFALYPNNKTQLAAFHLRQSLLINIIAIAINIILRFFWTTWILYDLVALLSIGLLILAIIGIINAVNGETKPLPLLGEPAQRMFTNI